MPVCLKAATDILLEVCHCGCLRGMPPTCPKMSIGDFSGGFRVAVGDVFGDLLVFVWHIFWGCFPPCFLGTCLWC